MGRSLARLDSQAQSLFPFLAVLLCAVGSLIVILVLAVSYAQTSAREEIAEAQQEMDVISDEMEFVSKETEARRGKQTEEIQAHRARLAHYEDHISRLEAELAQLQKTLGSMEAGRSELSLREKRARIEELQLVLQQSHADLQKKVEELRDKPPAYAILPYSGAQGTTRRPIYLECTKQGVILQPEGLLITLEDLGPPYGPGNPLDAALRLLGSEYEKALIATSSLSSPYPLLLIRPDGIRTYALARNAMGGWDDQFGYELVAADMELAFPESIPGLGPKVQQALVVARERQHSLLAAMPARYQTRASSDEELDSSPRQANNGWANMSSTRGTNADGWRIIQEAESASGADGTSWGDEGVVASGVPTSGENPSGPVPNPTGNSQRDGNSQPALATYPGAGGPSGRLTMGSGMNGAPGGNGALSGAYGPSLSNSGPLSRGASGSGPGGGGTGGGGNSNDPWGSQAMDQSGGSSNGEQVGGPSGTGGPGGSGSGSAGGNSGQGGNMPGPNLGMFASNGNASQGSAGAPGVGGSMAQNYSEMDAYDREQNPMAAMNVAGGSSPASSQAKPSTPTNRTSSAPNATLRRNTGKQNQSESASSSGASGSRGSGGDDKPISLSMGQDWASSREAGKTTPITRDIHMQVLPDRWLILSEGNLNTIDTSIDVSTGPQAAGAKLASSIRERVSSWGIAVARGYWKPRLILYPSRGSDLSIQRLQRLLEGSGVEIQIASTAIPGKR